MALAEMRMPIFREEPLALVRELYEQEPVSYTHLDVYKRQAARSGVEQAVQKGKTAVSTAVKGLMNAAKGNAHVLVIVGVFLLLILMVMSGFSSCGILFSGGTQAVSYTHRDVYKRQPLNRALRDENGEMYDAVAGTFLVVGLGEEDFVSLSPELAQKYEQLFHQPEAFLKLGNRLLVLPVPDEPPAEKPRTKPSAEHER